MFHSFDIYHLAIHTKPTLVNKVGKAPALKKCCLGEPATPQSSKQTIKKSQIVIRAVKEACRGLIGESFLSSLCLNVPFGPDITSRGGSI